MQKLRDNPVSTIQLGFLIIFIGLNLVNKVVPSIELLASVCIAIFIWRSQDRKLLLSLLPLFIMLLIYQSLRSFADDLSPSRVHIADLIVIEKALFAGHIPAHVVQSWVHTLPINGVIEFICNVAYMSHFVTPLIVALWFWFKKPKGYWFFVGGLLIVTYLGFIIYYLYPAAPPWLATRKGFLDDQPVILSRSYIYTAFMDMGPNQVAAMPSLHAAYPTFIFFTLFYFQKWKALPFILLPLTVGFATLYLGHHYIIDLVAGAGLSSLVFCGIVLFTKYRKKEKVAVAVAPLADKT